MVTSPVAEGRYAGRFELHPGDTYAGGNRAEMFNYTHDSEGTEGWYSWYTLFPSDFPRRPTWAGRSGPSGTPRWPSAPRR